MVEGNKMLVNEPGNQSFWLSAGSMDYMVKYANFVTAKVNDSGHDEVKLKLYVSKYPIQGSMVFFQLREFQEPSWLFRVKLKHSLMLQPMYSLRFVPGHVAAAGETPHLQQVAGRPAGAVEEFIGFTEIAYHSACGNGGVEEAPHEG
eukprot:11001957-Lingulodinium_polyedra.AAC.1